MSFTSAFLAGFASTALEQQKRAMEQRQFDATLAIQQAALQTQQQKFDQEMALRESERQDRLQQNEITNARQQELAGSLIQTRKENQTAKAQHEANSVTLQATAQQFSKGLSDLRLRKAELQGHTNDPSAVAQIQAIDQEIADQESKLAPIQNYLKDFYKERQGEGQTQETQPQAQEGAQAAPGQAPAGPLTGQPQAQGQTAPGSTQSQISGPGQAAPSGAPPEAPAPPATAAAQPPAPTTPPSAQPPAQPTEPGSADLRHIVDDPELAKRKNDEAKRLGLSETWTTPQQLTEDQRKKIKDQLDAEVASAAIAAQPKEIGKVSDAIRVQGLDKVDVVGHEKGTNTVSARVGMHLAKMLLGSGVSAGMTRGHSEVTLPGVEFVRSGVMGVGSNFGISEDLTPDETLGIAVGLKRGSQKTPFADPVIQGAQSEVRKRLDEIGGLSAGPTLKSRPFDSQLDPKRYYAADTITKMKQADQALSEISPLPYNKTPMPEVVDDMTTPKETLGLFSKLVTTKLDRPLPNMWPAMSKEGGNFGGMGRKEYEALQELQIRLKPDAEGRYSPEAVQAAKDAARTTEKARVTDPFKQAVQDVLKPILSQPDEEPKAGKKTSMGGAMSMPNAALLSSLGGLSQFGAEKANGGTAQANVDAATKAFGTVTLKTKANAPAAVKSVKSEREQMTDDEKTKLQTTWKARRTTWKDQYKISDDVLKDMNEAVGLDRNDGF